LIKGVGAFGTRANPTSFAAPRYTSVKRSDLARNALYVDLDIVPMVENHDGSAWMPRTFLPLIPLVLLNGIKGIATGWATNILPRRFEDLIGAVDDVLNKQPVRLLLPHYENRNVKVVPEASGNGKYIISGMVEQKNTTTIIVTELPPELPLEKFREQLSVLEEDGKIIGFTDRSTKTINVEIKMPRAILAKLETNGRIIEFLKLRSIVTENITVIVNGKVIQYSSAEELVKDWVDWRLQLYLDRFEKLVADEELTNLYWLYILACFEDELIPLIPSMSGKNELKDAILNAGHEQNGLPKASDDMLDKIANRPAYKWTKAGLDDA
jgi:DNA gyrase/topoisomerase IV subunit A